jgi:D-lactate dehydrogenase
MKILFYSARGFEIPYIKAQVPNDIEIAFTYEVLNLETAYKATGFESISIFTSDNASREVIQELKKAGVKFIGVRAAGYDNVDTQAATEYGICVTNVPNYSPNAVAEHTMALILSLNRKIVRANEQVHDQNFTLDNVLGFDLHKKKVGIIGTGRIGTVLAKILHGFGCTIIAYDIKPSQELENHYNVVYTGLNTLCSMCDIITVHLPLNDDSHHLIDKKRIDQMKRGVMLINTSRGAILNTIDVIEALCKGKIGYLGLDVYEFERGLFFTDRTGELLSDPMLFTLLNHPNVLITPHQGFATKEALFNIASGIFSNLSEWKNGSVMENEITDLHNRKIPTYQEIHSTML